MNKNGLGDELLKQDGIDPKRTSEAERAAFTGMLNQEKARTRRRRWITSVCLFLVALVLAIMWLIRLIPVHLTIPYLIAWAALAGVVHFCFVTRWLNLLVRRIKLKRTDRKPTEDVARGPVGPKVIPVYKIILKSRIVQSVAAALTVGLLLYSAYVTRYQPDPQGTIVLGQTRLFADSFTAFRILVGDYTKSLPIAGADVRLTIKGQGINHELGKFVTDRNGTLSEAVYIPSVPSGKYHLVVDSRSKVGQDHIVRPIEIKRAYRVYLTTDKPVYQPGQTIHIRALVLNGLSLKPYANQPILFEILDSKGNKVFKTNLTSSEYGIASCDFELAGEVNLGRYEIITTAGDVESQKTVTVKRYVLPKFKMELKTDKPFYLPSEKISGSIKADYFFGKPVTNAQVEVTGRTVYEEPTDIFKVTGTTDATGKFSFEARLADYFAGKALPAKNSSLEIEVKVKDSTGHEEIAVEKLPVAQQSINIHLFTDGNYFLRGIENIIYIMTAYPNGQPAVCDVDINGTVYKSDKTGITIFKANVRNQLLYLNIKARDQAGLTGALEEEIMFWHQGNNLLLRTDKAVYLVGETLNATILSSLRSATFFLDIIKNGRTMLTKTISADNGKAELAIDLSDDLCGTLKINVYAFTSNIDVYNYRAERMVVMDSRLIHVRRGNRLRLDMTLDKAVYQPGKTAKFDLTVTDSNGIPTPAALSLAAVDEAVFYVCENHPGLMEQFFLADRELLRPVYQIAFAFSPAKVLSGEEKYQNLARVLFSSEAQSINWRRLFSMPDYDEAPRSRRVSRDEDYTLQADSYSEKLTQMNVFRHRHINIPLAFLIILALLAVPFGLLGLLAHSIFRLFRKVTMNGDIPVQEQSQRAGNRRIYFFAFVVLLPTVTYLMSVVLGVLYHSYYLDDYSDIGLPFLVVLMIALAAFAFSLVQRSGPASILQTRKFAIKGFVLSLLCIGLVFIIMSITAMAITDIVFSDKIALVLFGVLLLLSMALYMVAGRTSQKPPGRFFSELGRSGHIVLVTGLAQTIIILVFVGLLLTEDAMRTLKRTYRTSTQRIIVSSGWGSVAGYGGMGGYGGGYYGGMGGYGGGMAGMGAQESYAETKAPPRIREYFPETLLWQPELITDDKGLASVDVSLADSITNWKMNIDAVSAAGKLGSSEIDIRVFQDFFVDVDLPVALTRNDEVSVPVLCYNYLQRPQTIQLTLQAASWYEALGLTTQTIELAPNDVKSASFHIKAREVGTHELTVSAKGSSMSDALKRSIEVRPDGTEVVNLQNGVLTNSAEHSFNIPTETIPNSQKLLLKFYPSRFSEVIEGLDTIFRMPYGCFEQTSSVTYPNVMALLYMERTGQVTPEIEVKARRFITTGYQRLLTFEVDGGGFDWFGKPPAQEKLTAYGIMELTDISKVHEIDQAVIKRASQWLLSRQNADGSWGDFQNNEKAQTSNTAYITWTLTEAGIRWTNQDKALAFLRQNLTETDSPYTIALTANAFLANDPRDPFGAQLVSSLNSQIQIQGGSVYIPSSGFGAMQSWGRCLDIETTALSALAIMKVNPYADTVRKTLTWLSEQKDAYGTWRSTQATVLAMKALIAGTGEARSTDEQSSRIEVTVNNQPAGSIEIRPEMRDLLFSLNLTNYLQQGNNHIRITQDQAGELPYRLVGTYWVPRSAIESTAQKELDIQVDYDKYRLVVDDTLRCSVQITRLGDTPTGMAIIDLGVPPGFSVDISSFEKLVESGTLAKYEVTLNQCILYIRSIVPDKPLHFSYELKALYPIRARVPSSTVYEYYQPTSRDQTRPIDIVINEQ
jgi:hypothetical protein